MEALVFYLFFTLIVIFFAVFSEKHWILKNKTILYGFILILMFFERITQIFRSGSKAV
jgi:hypothetical protein